MRSDVEHKQQAPRSVRCAIVTISDTRTKDTDTSGRAIADLLTAAGHQISSTTIVKDDAPLVRDAIEQQLGSDDVQVIISTGGTGITSRDSTFEAVDGLLEKRLDGFGELFRTLSYHEVGSAAMLSRAAAGIARSTAVFMLPGSEHAVRLAMTKLIAPELGHVVRELRR